MHVEAKTAVYTERKTCRACSATGLIDVLSLGVQFLANFVRVIDMNLPRAPLDLMRCPRCGLLQLKHTVAPDLCFRDYWYRSSINQTMRDALADVVMDGCRYVKEGVWLDIGANDGYLLSRVGGRFTKVACEPALNMHSLLEEHADKILADYFQAEPLLEMADTYDCITSCACFYDVDDPDRFVGDIAKCLAPQGVWINQLNDAPTILKNNAWDGICHEHLTYWSVTALNDLYSRHGLHMISIKYNDINGGSVRVAAAKARGSGTSPLLGVAEIHEEEVVAFASRAVRWKELMSELLDMPSIRGHELWGYGASTKGAVMLQYGGFADRVVAIADRNPAKWGTFAAGSWCPVLDEATMRKASPKNLLIFPWAFRNEFVAREAELRAAGTRLWLPLPNIECVL